VRPLSLSARIAIALHLFRGYCNRRGLKHLEIDRFVTHLWEFIVLGSLPAPGQCHASVESGKPLWSGRGRESRGYPLQGSFRFLRQPRFGGALG
jgi:hypothetical protein